MLIPFLGRYRPNRIGHTQRGIWHADMARDGATAPVGSRQGRFQLFVQSTMPATGRHNDAKQHNGPF